MGETNTDIRETHIIGRQTREQIIDQQACPALALYGIRMAGITDAAAPMQFGRRQPRISQCLVTLSGWGRVWTEGGWLHCATGTAYLTPPGTPHGYRAVEGVRWKFAWVTYDETAADGLVIRSARPQLVPADVQPLADAIGGLYRESLGPADPAVMHHWTQLVHSYARRLTGTDGPHSRLRPLWQSVDEHLSFPWTVAVLADRAGTSGEHLRRLCHSEIGRSPMRHVTHLRMRRAAALLASETFTVEAVAEQIGYDNAFAFSTAFKRHTGLSPSDYRAQRPAR